MIFQQVNINDVVANQRFIQICTEHPDCKGCPMVNGQVFENFVCETGRNKGEENK